MSRHLTKTKKTIAAATCGLLITLGAIGGASWFGMGAPRLSIARQTSGGGTASAPVPLAQTQAGMNQQAAREFASADAALNAAYKKLLPTLNTSRQKKLKAAQRAWLAFRDADAAFVAAEVEGGSMYPLVYANARTARTAARLKQLQGPGFTQSGVEGP